MQYIAFDIETTGFLPRVDQIVEIGAVKFTDGKVSGIFSELIDPGMPMPAAASRVNGITDEMLAGKPKVEPILEKFAKFCGDDPMVAHNAPFDVEFIKADILKLECPAPKGIILDTCTMARKVIQGAPNYKLGTLVDFLKIPVEGEFHRAEADAQFCGQVFGLMLQRIFRAGEPVVLENLINLSGNPLHFPQVKKQAKQLDLLAEF